MIHFESGTPVTSMLPAIIGTLAAGARCEFAEFEVAGRVQRRVTSVAVKELVATALERRKSTRAPFWNEVLGSLQEQTAVFGELGDAAHLEVLNLAGYHLDLSSAATHHPFRSSETATRLVLEQSIAGLRPDRILALRSRCVTDTPKREAHLQMLDFRLPVDITSQRIVAATVRAIGLQGWLLSSGRSYHFLGAEILSSPAALMTFLGRALLYVPIIDGRWIAHQMIEGQCALRVSSGNAEQIVPVVVDEI